MGWMKVKFAPGINRDTTFYASDGGWYDGNLIRFRDGFPEAWAGWTRFNDQFTMDGICRSIRRFSTLDSQVWLGLGTSKRFYMAQDDLAYDVTPLDRTDTLGTDPFATVDTTTEVTVTEVSHGRLSGSYVIFSGATAVNGIPDTDLNKEHRITFIVDPDTYTIEVDTPATSTGTGGGSSVEAAYLFYPGTDDQFYGEGWGFGGYGEDPWGGDVGAEQGDQLGIWSQDGWGEDVVANALNNPIFYWDATNPTDRMVDIRDLPGADGNAPAYARFILVSHRDRHLLAFGGSEFGTGNAAPLSVRWCNQENILDWDEASTTGTAGSIPFSKGSRFMAAISTQREILVWTDTSLYSMQYIGAPYIYSVDLIADASDINGMKSATIFNDAVFWWGRSGFFAYDGRVQRLPCPIWDYINNRTNYSQNEKIYAATNRLFGEVIWFYPSTGDEIDSYVTFNVEEGVWAYGSLARTAWLDATPFGLPLAALPDGRLFNHEDGGSDTSVSPARALDSWIESAPFELSAEGSYSKGDRFMFVTRIMPDLTFRDFVTAFTPSVEIELKAINRPGGGFTSTDTGQVVRLKIDHKEEFTGENHVRIRGRGLSFKIRSLNRGTRWRLGVPRLYVRTDGQR